MPRIFGSVQHAVFLLRKLGLRRFAIVVLYWLLRRYHRWARPLINRDGGTGGPGQNQRDPVLLYQMPKVGSTSLVYSMQLALVKAGHFNTQVHHAHTLTNLDLHERLVRDANGPAHQLALVQEYKRIRAALEADPHQHWNVISLVRDPVARQVSDFFHHLDRNVPDWDRRWREGSLTIEQVLENFLVIEDPTRHWFEGEILSVLGIDIYDSAFPTEAGYCIYSRLPKVSLLVIRLEDMNRVVDEAIEQFLGIKGFKLHSFNMGSESNYGEIYKAFKAKPLPAWYLEKAYSGRMARHFYSIAELEKFAEKWSKKETETSAVPVLPTISLAV